MNILQEEQTFIIVQKRPNLFIIPLLFFFIKNKIYSQPVSVVTCHRCPEDKRLKKRQGL